MVAGPATVDAAVTLGLAAPVLADLIAGDQASNVTLMLLILAVFLTWPGLISTARPLITFSPWLSPPPTAEARSIPTPTWLLVELLLLWGAASSSLPC